MDKSKAVEEETVVISRMVRTILYGIFQIVQ